MKFYSVTCKQGHHGNGHYQPLVFAVAAPTAIEAMDFAKQMPGVKHHALILELQEIPFREYCRLRQVSAYKRREYGQNS